LKDKHKIKLSKKEFIELGWRLNWKIIAMAAELKCSECTVIRYLKRLNIPYHRHKIEVLYPDEAFIT